MPLAGAGLLAYWWASGAEDGAGDDGGRELTLVDDRGADTSDPEMKADTSDPETKADTSDPEMKADTSDPAVDAETSTDSQVSQAVTVLDSRIINELLSGNGIPAVESPGDAISAGNSVSHADETATSREAEPEVGTGFKPEVSTSREAEAASKPEAEAVSSGPGPKPGRRISGKEGVDRTADEQQGRDDDQHASGDRDLRSLRSLDHQAFKPETPSHLIALSNEYPFSLSGEDLDFPSRLKQAEADAHVIELVQRSLQARHEGLVETTSRLRETLGSLEAMQQELLLAQSKVRDGLVFCFRPGLHLGLLCSPTQPPLGSDNLKQEHHQKQAQEIRHERTITRERIKRQEVLDSVRVQCDALTAALGAASERYARARELTRLSLSLRRIKDGLLDGQESSSLSHPSLSLSYSPATAVDGGPQEQDPLVTSALDSLQRNLAGTKPLAALRLQFEKDVKGPATELAYIPEGRGSMATALLSKIAAGLRVDGGNDEWDAIRRRVDAGQLLEAAEDLEKLVEGTASVRVVRDWVNDVRSTCRALQAIDVLESYCYLNV